MSEQQQDPQANQPAQSQQPQPAAQSGSGEVDFRSFMERVDAKFSDMGKQLGKIHEWRKSLAGEPDEGGAKPQESGPRLSPEDLDAAMVLGEKRAALPEAARARVDAMRKSGRSHAECVEFADALLDALKESKDSGGAKPSEPPTRDNPASGPRQTNGASVRTYREYQDLAYRAQFKGDADAKRRIDALNADPEFIPSSLPLK